MKKPTPIAQLAAYDEESGDLNVVIDTPQGSRNKFKYDEKHGVFKLAGVLPAGAVFPFDFGDIPGTLGEDGDPVDVLVLMDEPAFAGCLVPSRLIGVVVAEQTTSATTSSTRSSTSSSPTTRPRARSSSRSAAAVPTTPSGSFARASHVSRRSSPRIARIVANLLELATIRAIRGRSYAARGRSISTRRSVRVPGISMPA